VAARALALDPDDILLMHNVACIYSVLGELDLTIDLPERIVPRKTAQQISWFKSVLTSTQFARTLVTRRSLR
jgi:adenylate cyclase